MISDFGLFKIEEDDGMMVIVCGILGYVGKFMEINIVVVYDFLNSVFYRC